ncbi:glycerate kinase [Pseudomonas sp. F1_0610]|uniref:glycerate kinase n=1 Tax=Pseudomonas sp. F1_0610 TaxID=3114284 RepID=UPI0039C40567
MKIVIAPDSFKESLTALEVAQAIEQGFKAVFPKAEYVKVPMADGGEGTVQSLVDALDGELIELEVQGPLNNPVKAFYGWVANKQLAIIEMASASGLHHVPRAERNPYYTTSFGTGQLIVHALEQGAQHIILGLGGSATNDAGAGMLQALGFQLLDGQHQSLALGGLALQQLAHIQQDTVHPALAKCQIAVACDVDNPLCGERGASAIFGPQKGATAEQVQQLDHALSHFAQITQQHHFADHKNTAGAGAAGGMGFAALALLKASLQPGIQIVIEHTQLAKHLADADLVITGEGRIDAQTLYGKTPMGVAKLAKTSNKAVIAFAGSLSTDIDLLYPYMDAIFSITPGVVSLEQALEAAAINLEITARNVAASLKLI